MVDRTTCQTLEVFSEIAALCKMMHKRLESGTPPARDRHPRSLFDVPVLLTLPLWSCIMRASIRLKQAMQEQGDWDLIEPWPAKNPTKRRDRAPS